MPGCLRAAMSRILSQGLPHPFSDALVKGGSQGACSCLTKLINSVLMGGQVKVIICHSVTSANVILSLIVCVLVYVCLYVSVYCMFMCACLDDCMPVRDFAASQCFTAQSPSNKFIELLHATITAAAYIQVFLFMFRFCLKCVSCYMCA